jgi:biotin-(acetyl-CoA carboxylase) ligase
VISRQRRPIDCNEFTDLGCGLNVLNKPPIPSLALLQELNSTGQKGGLTLESTAAVIMARFESMWDRFRAGALVRAIYGFIS